MNVLDVQMYVSLSPRWCHQKPCYCVSKQQSKTQRFSIYFNVSHLRIWSHQLFVVVVKKSLKEKRDSDVITSLTLLYIYQLQFLNKIHISHPDEKCSLWDVLKYQILIINLKNPVAVRFIVSIDEIGVGIDWLLSTLFDLSSVTVFQWHVWILYCRL